MRQPGCGDFNRYISRHDGIGVFESIMSMDILRRQQASFGATDARAPDSDFRLARLRSMRINDCQNKFAVVQRRRSGQRGNRVWLTPLAGHLRNLENGAHGFAVMMRRVHFEHMEVRCRHELITAGQEQ